MTDNFRGTMTISAQSIEFEHLPLRKAFLKALAPAGRMEEDNKESNAAVVERSSKATHTRYSKPLFLREARIYANIQEELEHGLRATKRLRMSNDDEEEEVCCRIVSPKQLLQESGVVFQPAVNITTTDNQNDFSCQFLIQGCPRCKIFFTEDIQLIALKAIESTFCKYYRGYTNADVGTTSLFALSSLGDLLLNCRDDIDTMQNFHESLNWDGTTRQRIFLQRMLSPMVGYCLHCKDTFGKSVSCATLVDVLLQVKPIQPHILGALIQSLRILIACSLHIENKGDFTSLQINDLIDLITSHIERLTYITCDSIKMVFRCDNVNDAPHITNGKELMEQIKKESWWEIEASDMMTTRSKASGASFCDKSIRKIYHHLNRGRIENGDQDIIERLSHQPPIRHRRLLRSVRLQVLEQSLTDVEHKSRYLINNDENIHEKLQTATAILRYKKSFLTRIQKARSAAEKRICFWSEEDDMIQPKMRSSRISSGSSLFLKRDQVAQERCVVVCSLFASHLFSLAVKLHSTRIFSLLVC
jgi:hypothetical protein